MTEQSTKHQIKIRTYAGDLELAKKQREKLKSVNTPKTESKPVINIPKKNTDLYIKNESIEKNNNTNIKSTEKIPIKPKVDTEIEHKTILKKLPEISLVEPSNSFSNKNQLSESGAITKIPAFHELQKQVSAIQHNKKTQKPTKIGPKPTENSKNKLNIGYDTAIITDNKSGQFKFFPSLLRSIEDWFNKLKASRKRKKNPTYSVPEAERRKGVIQKATSKSATIFTSDSSSIKERIRRRQEQHKNLPEEAETIWSPNTETGYNLLEAPDVTQNVVLQYKNTKNNIISTVNIEAKPELSTEQMAVEESQANQSQAEVPSSIPVNNIEVDDVNNDVADERWSETENISENNEITIDNNQNIINEINDQNINTSNEMEKQLSVQVNQIDSLDNESIDGKVNKIEDHINSKEKKGVSIINLIYTNKNVALLVILFLMLSLTVASSGMLLGNIEFSFKKEMESPEINIDAVLNNTVVSPVYLDSNSLNNIVGLLKNQQSSSEDMVELALVAPDYTEISSAYTFNLLNFRATPNLKQSIVTTRFLLINNKISGLVLEFSDINSVKGGLLQWEPNMITDLSLLNNKSTSINNYFIDKEIAGISTRILQDREESVILIYGFISDKFLVITNDTDIFSNLAEKHK